jgi:hypothetical protein
MNTTIAKVFAAAAAVAAENSMRVLDLGWRTVGTGGMSLDVLRAWLGELPADFTANPLNLVSVATSMLDREDDTTDIVLAVVEFFCQAVYVRGAADELLKTVDRYITLWRELAMAITRHRALVVRLGVWRKLSSARPTSQAHRRHSIASAQAICPSKPSVLAMSR